MDWYRVRHTLGMYLTRTAVKRADYIRKHNIFYHMGSNCMTMFRKIPLYPKLISFGDNVWVASNVTFITHDVIHKMINTMNDNNDLHEYVGCIDIKDNVFIGANTTILSNVSIGPNVIIGAGSLVNKNLSSGVYAGVPAKYICSLEEFTKKRTLFPEIELKYGKTGLTEESIKSCWTRFEKEQQKMDGNR